MDFITDLPETEAKHTGIFVVVDRFSKMAHFIPLTREASAKTVARVFFKEVVKYHGLPATIVSDRDTRFTGNFWRELFKSLGTELDFSTAYHP